MSIQGLDVSEFQGEIDWERVKAAGYRFAMLRAGYGAGTEDRRFRRNASECSRIGLPFGAYWFCYAATPSEAAAEADSCIKTVSPFCLEYPVCYDIEEASADYIRKQGTPFTVALARKLVRSFCSRVEEKGYFSMFYSNRNFIDTYLGNDLRKRYALWYARYSDRFDGTSCGIWQYSSQGSVPGIKGDVDLDRGFTDYPYIIRKAGLNHLSERPSRPAAVHEPDYVTYVLRPGDTLSKIADRFGTTVSALAELNHISNPDQIYAGDTIRIPERDTT